MNLMEVTHYLLQTNLVNSQKEIELYNHGYLVNADKKSYFISFHESAEDANTVLGKAIQYSASRFRYQEQELITAMLKLLPKKYPNIDGGWLAELYEYDAFDDLEQVIIEYMVVEYEEGFFDFDSFLEDAKASISDKTILSLYKVCPIAQIGSDIKLSGINCLLDVLDRDPMLKQQYADLTIRLKDYKEAAERTKLTMNILGVEEKEFANLFLVADKTVVSKWCNAVRKADNFRLAVMDYLIEHPHSQIVDHLRVTAQA